MKVLIVVINNIQKLDDLLLEINENGYSGGTVIDSKGMAKTLFDKNAELPLFGSLKHILNENKHINKTLFMVLPDEKLSGAMDCVRRVLTDLDDKNAGIMFTVPVTQAEGLTK